MTSIGSSLASRNTRRLNCFLATATLTAVTGACGLGDSLVGTQPTPDRRAEAATRILEFPQALGEDGGDFGWTLLHPMARESFGGDRQSYEQALGLSSAGWRASDWELGSVTRDDDLYCARLRLRVGYDPPALLTDDRHQVLASYDDGGFRVCVFLGGERESGIVGG